MPWVIRARDMLGVTLPAHVAAMAGRARAASVDRGRGADGARAVSEITIQELRGRLGEVAVLDVRTAGEFDGSNGKPCDPRQGHIPGARNIDVYRLMNLELAEIEAELGIEPGAEVIAYCHGGSRSAIATQMLRALGYEARNYVGSWHEWSRHDDLPIEGAERSAEG